LTRDFSQIKQTPLKFRYLLFLNLNIFCYYLIKNKKKMVSFVKKIKKMYKGSYFYANKKYGKYTKRRPFPNFNDFDCSPSGDFSVSEVPTELNINKQDNRITNFERNNSYITYVNDNNYNGNTERNSAYMNSSNNFTSNVSTPVNNDIFDHENQTSNISPVTTISDNTDFTVVNNNDYQNNLANPFNNAYEIKQDKSNIMNAINPFYDSNNSFFDTDDSFTTNVDGTNVTDYYGNKMKQINGISNTGNNFGNNDKTNSNGKNNWKPEIKRYSSSIPQAYKHNNYDNDITNNNNYYNQSHMEIKKKSKWWKKILPRSKSSNSFDSNFSDSTYDNYFNNNDDYEYNPKRYDSAIHSELYSHNNNYGNNNFNSSRNRYSYSYNPYESSITDGVLVLNKKAKKSSKYF